MHIRTWEELALVPVTIQNELISDHKILGNINKLVLSISLLPFLDNCIKFIKETGNKQK